MTSNCLILAQAPAAVPGGRRHHMRASVTLTLATITRVTATVQHCMVGDIPSYPLDGINGNDYNAGGKVIDQKRYCAVCVIQSGSIQPTYPLMNR